MKPVFFRIMSDLLSASHVLRATGGIARIDSLARVSATRVEALKETSASINNIA